MEKTGIIRRIDDLGRIVIPKEIRKNLKIRDSDEIEISITDNRIILNKYESLKKDKAISYLLYVLGKSFNNSVLFTSKEKVIDCYNKEQNNYVGYELSNEVMNIINNRKVVYSNLGKFPLFKSLEEIAYVICPLVINGDLIGSLIVYSNEDISKQEHEIITFCKMFLENYLE